MVKYHLSKRHFAYDRRNRRRLLAASLLCRLRPLETGKSNLHLFLFFCFIFYDLASNIYNAGCRGPSTYSQMFYCFENKHRKMFQ